MSNRNVGQGDLAGLIVIGVLIVLVICIIGFRAAGRPVPTEPTKPINWEKAGQTVGDRLYRFGHGTVKGAKEAAKEIKERDKGN